jgi:hypothetical protein
MTNTLNDFQSAQESSAVRELRLHSLKSIPKQPMRHERAR